MGRSIEPQHLVCMNWELSLGFYETVHDYSLHSKSGLIESKEIIVAEMATLKCGKTDICLD